MERTFSVVCNEGVATEIETLAREHDVTEQEVIRQLLSLGLEALDRA